ncbi:MAG: NADH-quinone oxidoreductase subunit C [Candidatus Hadarchaeum sp.]|uniref:NADH-quinone oxidoreductase subunit C n=1 Tax=Candidatus Hadarchaeum sp. TaxID=2883567 RepID=UPI00317D9FBF
MNAQEVADLIKPEVDEIKIISERCLFASSDKKRFLNILKSLKDNGVTHISTITALDNGKSIELIYHFDCKPALLNLKIFLPMDDLKIPTITDLFPGAVLYERDIMEMIGVIVEGHPDPRRLFLPEDWPQGKYPLRKQKEEKKT